MNYDTNFYAKYQDKELCQALIAKIKALTSEKIKLMEVCGTHTMSIFRYGIKELLPKNIHLISGPGCPVCVTAIADIDYMIALAKMEDTIIATFGDMINVPGSQSSLKKEKAKGADIRVIYCPHQALEIAEEFPKKRVILIGIGFETTIPLLSSVVLETKKKGLTNFYLLSLAKVMPPIIDSLLKQQEVKIDGIICPGHVSTIIGTRPYQFIPERYNIACVIAGFEPVDILLGIYHLVKQKVKRVWKVENKYKRAVRDEGNPVALNLISRVFSQVPSEWRGIGVVKASGMELRSEFSYLNARNFKIQLKKPKEHTLCRCGEVLRGVITPLECPLFNKECSPENPIGPCMVSSEGTCAAYYKYGSL